MEFSQPSYEYPSGSFQLDITFTFKKSVFFVDNVIICLGSGISSSNSATKITQVVNDILFCVFFSRVQVRIVHTKLQYIPSHLCKSEMKTEGVLSRHKTGNPLEQITDIKILLTTYQILHDQSANYRKKYRSSQKLLSTRSFSFSCQMVKANYYGGRAFAFAARKFWNSIPDDFKKANNVFRFKTKTIFELFIRWLFFPTFFFLS